MVISYNKKLGEANSTYISIVVPVYGCETCIVELYNRICHCMLKITEQYEIIMVNDDSPQNDWSIVKQLAEHDARVCGINLSRNFGQYNAITAGLQFCKGDWVIVMDCDLQDQPEEIEKLHSKALEGYDMVIGRRNNRKDNIIKKTVSASFYRLFSYLTETNYDSSISQFGIYNRKVINAILSMRERMRHFPTIANWVGFKKVSIDVVHSERLKGKSSYSYRKLFNLAIDVITTFSVKPLRLIVNIGLIISISSFFYAVSIFYNAIMGYKDIEGWSSLIVSISFFSGIIIFTLGIVGIYIGRVFEEVKSRPIYIVDEVYCQTLNKNDN